MIYNLPKNIDLIIDFITIKPEAKKKSNQRRRSQNINTLRNATNYR